LARWIIDNVSSDTQVVSQLSKLHPGSLTLLGFLVTNCSCHSNFLHAQVGDILHYLSAFVVTDKVCLALSSLLVALIYVTARSILVAHGHLATVVSVLAVKEVGAVHIECGCVHVFDQVLFHLCVVVQHGQGMSHVLSEVLLFLAVLIYFLLNFIDLALDVVETPLLRLLHLNHHLLNLFELLEAVSLHFLQLLLFCHQHG
jgi:hypothetical protein